MNVSETSEGYKIELMGSDELQDFERKAELTAPFTPRPFKFEYNACGPHSVVGVTPEGPYATVHHEVYNALLRRGKCNVKAKCWIPGKAAEQTLDIVVLKTAVVQTTESADTLEDEDVDEDKED